MQDGQVRGPSSACQTTAVTAELAAFCARFAARWASNISVRAIRRALVRPPENPPLTRRSISAAAALGCHPLGTARRREDFTASSDSSLIGTLAATTF